MVPPLDKKNQRAISAAVGVSSVADGGYFVLVGLFLLNFHEISVPQVGLILAFVGACSLCSGVVIGFVDRKRIRPALIAVLNLVSSAGLFTMAVSGQIYFVVLGAVVFRSAARAATTIRSALLPSLFPENSLVDIRASVQVAFNLGLAVGALLSSVVLFFDTERSFQTFFLMATLLYALSALVFWGPRLKELLVGENGQPKQTHAHKSIFRDRIFFLFIVLHTILLLNIPIIDLVLPYWTLTNETLPTFLVPTAFLINILLVIAFQKIVSRRVKSVASSVAHYRRASVLLLVSFALYGASGLDAMSGATAIAALLVAAAVQTFAEMMQLSAGWFLSYAAASKEKHGQYQAVFGQAMPLAEMIAPLLLTATIYEFRTVGWVGIGLMFLVAGHLITVVTKTRFDE